jgi:hypothetical protein
MNKKKDTNDFDLVYALSLYHHIQSTPQLRLDIESILAKIKNAEY